MLGGLNFGAVCRIGVVEDLLGSGLDKRRRWWVFWSAFLGGAGEGGASILTGISTLFAGSEAEEWTSEL